MAAPYRGGPAYAEGFVISANFLKRKSTQANGVGTADAAAGIDDTDGTDYRGRSWRWNTDNDECIVLCDDGEDVDGTILDISSGKATVATVGMLHFRNGTAAALTRGKRIVGTTRVVESGGTAQRGYVKTLDDVPDSATALNQDDYLVQTKAKGTVVKGGAVPTANAEAVADVVVAFGMG